MAINVIYQKKDFGTFEKNSQRSVFVDEKRLEEVETKVEFNLGTVLKEIQEFILRFDKLSKELNLGQEIKSSSDFFSAKYLQQPEYNFHEKALQISKILDILLSNFVSAALAVIAKIENARPKSEAEANMEIAKIKKLELIAKRLTGGDFKLLEPRLKSPHEFLTEKDYEKYKADAQADSKKQKAAFEQKLKAKVEEFGESIADSEEAIKGLKIISEEIIKGQDSSKQGYKLSKRLGFLALKNADKDKKTVILSESALEGEIIRLLNEFEQSKQLIEQQYKDSGNFGNELSADNYQFRARLLERISWLRRALLNLLELYVGDITRSISTEAALELEEIQVLSKIKEYLNFLSQLPPLFREIFQVGRHIAKLSEVDTNVNFYSRESLKWGNFGESEMEWLSEELKKLDYLFSSEQDLTNKINPEKQAEIPREKLIDIIPREVRIQRTADTIISGDLYLKDVNYKPKVGIIALHGVIDSRRVYYSLAVRAANMGFLVYCPDLPSHGHPSEGTFKFGTTSESMLLAIRHLKENYGLEKIAVIGWSLGSMVALFEMMHYTSAIEELQEKFSMNSNAPKNSAEHEANRKEMRLLILSEYEKYKDCKIDAILLLTPVDYTQIAMRLKSIQDLMGEKFPLFVNTLLFLGYRQFSKESADSSGDKDNPPGTRFYFRKRPGIKGVKDSDSGKRDGFYRRLINKFKLDKIEDPVQARALKLWKPEEVKYFLLAPSQIAYFALLSELCPEIVAEIRRIPKIAIYGEDDTLTGMRKRGMDLIKLFESFGNVKTVVLKGMGHDLDYNGDGHSLYIDPVLIKHFYDFFLLAAQQ